MRTVLVETMPKGLRGSHLAAGNSGVWPHNGAVRVMMLVTAAREAVESDPEWTSVVRPARRGDRRKYGRAVEDISSEW